MAGLPAATVTWTGGSPTTNNWSDAGNWGGTLPVAGDSLVFDGATKLTAVNDFIGTSFASISFPATAGDFILSGEAFTLTGGATAVSSAKTSGTITIGNAVTFGTNAPTITTAAGGTLLFTNAIANGGLLVSIVAGGPVTLSGAVTGAGGLTKSGSGALTLSGLSATAASNYAGATTIEGALVVSTTNPVLSGALTFGLTAGSTNLSSLDLSAASLTCGAFTVRGNSLSNNIVTIGNGQTFTTGSVTVGNAVNGTTTLLTVSGGGTWAVNAPNGLFSLGGYNPAVTNNTNQASIDLSGLSTFICSLTTGSMQLGHFGDNATRTGSLTLANTANTINAATLTLGVGGSGTTVGLRLGAGTNVLQVDTLNIGTGGRDSGLVQFQGANGTLQLRNRAGNGRAAVNVQTGTANTGYTATNTLNLAGHSVDLQISNLVVGAQPRAGLVTNIISFDTGTLDVTGIRLGLRSGTTATANAHTSTLNIGGGTVTIGTGGLEVATSSATGGTANLLTGTVNVSGGTVTIANNTTLGAAVRLANNSAASGGTTANGALNITGGTVTAAGNITLGATTRPATATLTLNGGSLNVSSAAIGAATALVTCNLQAGTLANVAQINGGGAVAKTTAGVLLLSGTNAWSGATTISAGTLRLGSTNALPAVVGGGDLTVTGTLDLGGFSSSMNALAGAGSVINSLAGGGVLTVGSSNSSATFSGVIADGASPVALVKAGTGTQTLSGTNTYTGATTISAGSLRVTGSTTAASAVTVVGTLEGTGTVGGSVTMSSGGAIAPGSGGTTIATLTTGGVTCAVGGSYVVDLDGLVPTADVLSTTGNVALAGTLSVASNSNGGGGKVYTIVNAGSLSGTFAGLPNGATLVGGGRAFTVNYTATTVTLTDISSVWDGGGADDLWSTKENWEGNAVPAPGSNLVFAGITRLTPVNDLPDGTAFSSLNFASGAGNFSISAIGTNRLVLTSGATALTNAASSGTMTISAPLTFSTSAPTITTTAGGALVLSGAIDNGGMNVTTADAGPLTISGVLGGNGSLIKTGTGTLTLSGQGTWSGGTMLTRGDLVIAASGGAVSGPLGTGTLTLDSAGNPARVLLSGGQTVSNPLVMTNASPGAGLGALQHTGTGLATWSGPLTLNADNTNGGHLFGGADAANALVLAGAINSGGTLTRMVQRNGVVIYSGTAGNLSHLSVTGTARWGADNPLPATVALSVTSSGTAGEPGIIDLNGFNQTVASLIFQNQAGGTVATGTGTLTLAGDLSTTFTGTLTGANLITGNLALGGGTRTMTVADSSAANDLTISAVISDGGLTKAGAGRLELSGTAANTHTGTTTVSAGSLNLAKTAGVVAIPGPLAITGGQVLFGATGQLAATTAVTMSGTTSVFNGTAANAGQANLSETFASLTMTGGAFNCGLAGGAPVVTVSGVTSITGGGNTIFIGHSGTTFTTGSLALTNMTATAGGTVATNNSFTIYGNHTTVQSSLAVGAGGIALTNSVLNLRRGAVGAFGSRLVLDGDITTAGTNNCSIIEDGNGGTVGAIALELSSTAPAVTRTITAASGAGVLTISVPITNGVSASAGFIKAGTSQLTLGGTLPNTYTGVTTVNVGQLRLLKTSGVTAIPGDLAITGGQLVFVAANINQIADTSAVTMSGTTSIFNGTGVNAGNVAMTETIASLTVTGGCFNAATGSVWTITGALSFTGGGNTIFVGNNGHTMSVGSLSLTNMTATAGATVGTNNSFTIYGTHATVVTTLTVGSGGVTLDGSVLNLRRGAAGQQGSRLVLNGPVSTSGTAASSIWEDTNGGTNGTIAVQLSGSAGAVTRTITTPAGADLTISIPVTDGAATPGGLTKAGAGALLLSAVNTCTGAITVDAGTLTVTGSTTAASAVTVNAGATLAGTGTVSGTVAMNGGTFAPGTGGTTIGTLTTGAITWGSSSAYVVDLNGTGLLADRISVPGLSVVVDGTLSVGSFLNGATGQVFTIVSAASVSGTFTGIPDGTVIPASGRAVRVNYLADSVTCTVMPAPTVTAITPAVGAMADLQPVQITGTEFQPGATVTIGGNPATSVVWVSSTRIDAVTPAGAQGWADVRVTNPDLQVATLVAGYLYQGPAPVVTGVTPPNGPALSATPVTISGSGFFPGSNLAVSVGGVAAAAVTYVNATTITATFPTMSPSTTDTTADVVLTNGDGPQGSLANAFTYELRPVDTASGAIAGLGYRYHRVGGPLLPDFNTLVPTFYGVRADATLTGANPFEGRFDLWSVEFGGYVTVPADGVYTFYTASDDGSRLYIGSTRVVENNFQQGVVERSGQIALSAGLHRLRVEYAQGTGGFANFVRWQGPTVGKQDIPVSAFTCDPAPVVSAISPTSGPQAGGTAVTITGSGFVAGSLVAIGGTRVLNAVVLDENTITATTAGGTTGAKDVLVIGPRSGGSVLAGAFTYGVSPAPTLTAIMPDNGTATGGTTVRLTVSNVGVVPTVTFNGTAATSVVLIDATTVECVTPAMPATDATATVVMTAGGQSATLTDGFTWNLRTPENPTGTQAGLSYSYYRVGGPLLPTFSTQTAFSTGVRTTPGFTTNVFEARNDNWSVRYLAYLTVPSDGLYTLYTESDDGSRMHVGTTMVVDNNFAQGMTERSGVIGLAAGTHLVAIEFAQGNGGFGLNVRWSGPGLTKAVIPASAFTCDPVPVITSLDVINGPQSGGTVVTITGSGFTSGASVTFGGAAATGVVVSGGGTTLTCTTPSHAVGLVDVSVFNLTGTNATLTGAFTYDPSSGPTITSITPASGPAIGGTSVTINGTGFVSPMTVTIGGQPATNVVVDGSGASLTAVTPAMQSATLAVDVVVTNGGAQSATLPGGFTYTLRVPENPGSTQAGLLYRYYRVGGPLLPTFSAQTPFSTGVRNTPVIAAGTNPFEVRNDNWSVEYRGYVTVPADDVYTFYTESDDGSQLLIGDILLVQNNFAQGMTERNGSIGLAAGTHSVTIRFAQGGGGFGLNVRWRSSTITKALIPDAAFSTDASPTFLGMTPVVGPIAGGTSVTITGSGFNSGTTVTIGGTAATSVVTAIDGASLTAVTPAHALGAVPVVITNAVGLSVTQNNAYTYQGPAPVVSAVSPQVGSTAGGTTILIYGSNFAAGAIVTVGGVAATDVSLSSGVLSARTPAGTRGPATVTVTNIDGTSGSRSPGFYYQGPAPIIGTITPASGPMAGGTAVTISGSNFDTGATVTFDGIAQSNVTVVNATTITLTTVAGAQGPANVVVTNTDLRGTTAVDGYIFEGPAPTITAISPTSGLLAGGTAVTITGTNFVAGAVVRFDGVAATGVTVVDANTITATTPAGTQGPADVTVTNIDLLTATLPASYFYRGPPTIGSISPTRGPMAGGTTVIITGTNFAAGAAVTFDGVAAASVTVVDDTTITVTTAAGAQGPADVTVTNFDMSAVTAANGFIFEGPAPTVTGVSPGSGPLAGGTSVTISGSNFAAGAVVTFDGVAATAVTVTGPGTITATTPAGTQGFADVTVTNVDLLSATLTDGYLYLGQPPSVGGVSPMTVPNGYPTTTITISGSGFVTGVQVTIGGVAVTVTGVTQGTPDTITVTLLPGLPPGPAAIVVTNIDLQSTTFNGFIVLGDNPILTGIDVPHGPVAGGRLMTLTGSNFRPGAIVTMGGVPATIVTLSATTITAMTPPHDDGEVDVIVTNDDLLPSNPLTYTYYNKVDDHTSGNGCGTGGGLTAFLLLAFLFVGGGFSRRR